MSNPVCSKCGAALPPSSSYCSYCGTSQPGFSRNDPQQSFGDKVSNIFSLHNVAKRQRIFLFALLFLILSNLCVGINNMQNQKLIADMEAAQTEEEREAIKVSAGTGAFFVLVGLFQLAAVVFAIFSMIKLTQSLQYATISSILLSLLLIIPLIALITMFVVNGQATRKLTEAGYRVGLFGINPDLVHN